MNDAQMATELLQRFSLSCSHQFSWPRQSQDGDCYQVCLQCGVRYAYDWSTMRRAAPLREGAANGTAILVRGHRWRPRERRLKLTTPVAYRPRGTTKWLSGSTVNISRSGLLLLAEQFLAVETMVEFVLDMPVEIM